MVNFVMIEIIPLTRQLNAFLEAPPSKAHTLRLIFIATLAKGKSIIRNALLAEDQLNAIQALREFGVKIQINEKSKTITIEGANGKLKLPKKEIFVGNSGVTMRFLAAIAALTPKGKIVITGNERMQQRPIGELLKALNDLGVKARALKNNNCPPIEIYGGGILGGKTEISGKESSQFFSAILIASPYAKQEIELKCKGEMKSKPYIDITLQLMQEFGVETENPDYKKFLTKPGKGYKGKEIEVEGDFSNASYFFAAAAITHGVIRVTNLSIHSKQGDKRFVDLLEEMGCGIFIGNVIQSNALNAHLNPKDLNCDFVEVHGAPLKGITADMKDFPDIVPSLAIVAAFAEGKTFIKNIGHLRIKESDRIKSVASQLRKIGCKVKTGKDFMEIEGISEDLKKLHGAEIECFSDHRIAMAFSIVGLAVPGIKILDEKCVAKSFPNFFEELKKLGGVKKSATNIVLIGYRGTGKSKIGKLLAEKIGKRFVDSDDEIAIREHKPIREIFKEKGEEHFRKIEEQVIEDLCKQQGIVLACGGGVPTRQKNVQNFRRNGVVFLLTASPEKILSRIGGDKERPRLTKEKTELGEIKKMLELRKAFYEKAADYVIDSEHDDEQKKVEEIVKILKKEKTKSETYL